MRVLYFLNHAGKAGTERYVETLVRYLNHTRVEAYFAYNETGLLVERLEALGVPCRPVAPGGGPGQKPGPPGRPLPGVED